MKTIISSLLVLLISSMISNAHANTELAGPTAEEVVVTGVQHVLDLMETDLNGEQFNAEMERLLDEVVGFKIITARVMGDHFKKASKEQKYQFLEVFKKSMVDTYAAGMQSFKGYQVVVVPAGDDKKDTVRNTRIHLEAVAPDGTKYPIVQSMYYSKGAKSWKMQNIIFNGVNLGITFKSQFDQIMRETEGDISAAIEKWQEVTQQSFEVSNFE